MTVRFEGVGPYTKVECRTCGPVKFVIVKNGPADQSDRLTRENLIDGANYHDKITSKLSGIPGDHDILVTFFGETNNQKPVELNPGRLSNLMR